LTWPGSVSRKKAQRKLPVDRDCLRSRPAFGSTSPGTEIKRPEH
jgi:hypothetical protein